jgi:superfamily II DNA/RNA helicase
MELINCGVSGRPTSNTQCAWETLGLSPQWTRSLSLLSGTEFPRPIQIEAFSIHEVLNSRRNLLVSAPTNAGKSLVGLGILLDAAKQGGRAVLLEPLRALAREKADELSQKRKELNEILQVDLQVQLTTGDYRLANELFTSPPPKDGQLVIATPERFEAILRNPDFNDWFESVTAVCIDEAHLISDPRRGATLEYVLTSLITRRNPPRLVLLSASLGQTERVLNWLEPCDLIQVKDRCPPLAKQLALLTEDEKTEDVVVELVAKALQTTEANVLIFVYQTASTTSLSRLLNERLGEILGPKGCLPFHSQMSSGQREANLLAVKTGLSRCVVATTSLGLGVNLPATDVIIRDTVFPNQGPLSIAEVLQMAGRAGRGNREGTATILLRPSDNLDVNSFAREFRDEPLPELVSSFDRVANAPASGVRQGNLPAIATLVALQLAKHGEQGASTQQIENFFLKSLGGGSLAKMVSAALSWMADPSRLLVFRSENNQHCLTSLGAKAIKSTLPLPIASGFGQLLRDLLQVDSSDTFLSQWNTLDHLVVIESLSERSPTLKRFTEALPDHIEAWMERNSSDTPLIYREWLRGGEGRSRADEFLGSLGRSLDSREARKTGLIAMFRAIILFERARGVPISDLERQWQINNLAGVEEQWRDQNLWLLGALRSLLDIRCFFYCLREECGADNERCQRVKRQLRRMYWQLLEIQENLKYCSPLGGLLKSIQRTQKSRVGLSTIRRLESAGVTNVATLATKTFDQLVGMGIRRNAAKSILNYFRQRAT